MKDEKMKGKGKKQASTHTQPARQRSKQTSGRGLVALVAVFSFLPVLSNQPRERGQGSLLWRYSMSCCPARTAANARFYCPCVLSIVALILLPLGISMIADAGLANVETDFIALGKVCNVTAIHHRSDTITSTNFAGQGAARRKYYTHACWDYYNYTLSLIHI